MIMIDYAISRCVITCTFQQSLVENMVSMGFTPAQVSAVYRAVRCSDSQAQIALFLLDYPDLGMEEDADAEDF